MFYCAKHLGGFARKKCIVGGHSVAKSIAPFFAMAKIRKIGPDHQTPFLVVVLISGGPRPPDPLSP